ncbi:MAG TPA: MFS transporter [Bacteroidota bacterium]|jgi:UMF1 family MFS transporter|nr:MFS transporter [Bacteroidota bacterium]
MPDSGLPSHRRSRIFSWTLFDFANTAFSVIIVTVIFSRYFTSHVAGGQRFLWGAAVSMSMILAAVLSPPLGAAADFSSRRKRFLFFFTLVSVICTALLFFVRDGMILTGMALFILANIGFEGGLVFYDAFLPSLTSSSSYGRVSGYGFAMGYAGALAVLVIVNILLPESTNPDYLFFVRLSFVIAAGFFFIFSLPIFFFVPEPRQSRVNVSSYFKEGIRRANATYRSLFVHHEHPSISRFLIAFFVYNDGILTIIAFAAIFAEQVLHMTDKEIIVFFAVVQTSAILGSLVFGVLTDKIGPKKTIVITLCIWIAICLGAFVVQSVAEFYAVALVAGIAIGSSQSASRSMMAMLTPKDREAEFFGFYDGLCGKASAVVGPLVYGLIADLSNERVAALCIGIFFLAGLLILRGVEEPERRPALS